MLEQALEDSIAVAGMFEIPTGSMSMPNLYNFPGHLRTYRGTLVGSFIPDGVDKAYTSPG